MPDDPVKPYGLSREEWEAAFRPGMIEFAATRITITLESSDFARIAFGNQGPWIAEGQRGVPVFTHAVSLPPAVAVDFARIILKLFGQPNVGTAT